MKTIRNPWGTLERCWCSGWCTAPPMWILPCGTTEVAFFFFQTSQTKQKQNSAGSSFKLCSGSYSLRMMSTARGGLSRQLGSIAVKLDWLFMLAAGGLLFPPPNKRCSTPASWCRFSPAEWQELLSVPKLCADGLDGWCVEESGRTANSAPLLPATRPPPRTRLGPAVIGRAGSPANHSPHVRVTA